MLSILYYTALFWAIVHGIHCFIRRKSDAPSHRLPRPVLSRRGSRQYFWIFNSQNTRCHIKMLNVKIETTAFRDSTSLADSRLVLSPAARKVGTAFYDLGIIVGVVGMLATLAFLLMGALTTVLKMADYFDIINSHALSKLTKRSNSLPLDPSSPPISFNFNLILPGLTVPSSHTLPIFLTLLLCQVIHEAGHAFAALIASVTPLSAGLGLHLVFPSAFVSLPASLYLTLPRTRLRIITAGVWHNIIVWTILFVIIWSGIGRFLATLVGWRDVSRQGVVVTGFTTDSELRWYIPKGSVITKLDDLLLGTPENRDLQQPLKLWNNYLGELTGEEHRLQSGWCVEKGWFDDQPTACCVAPYKPVMPPEAPLSCFSPILNAVGGLSTERCLDPVALFTSTIKTSQRCESNASCEGGVCVLPHAETRLARIAFLPPPWESLGSLSKQVEKLLVWNGPKREILQQVHISLLQPLSKWHPIWLPSLIDIFAEYIKMISLSLFFFNMLPLPILDGGHALEAVLDSCFANRGQDIFDLEMGTPSPLGHGRQGLRKNIAKAITAMTAVMVGIIGGGALLFQVVLT